MKNAIRRFLVHMNIFLLGCSSILLSGCPETTDYGVAAWCACAGEIDSIPAPNGMPIEEISQPAFPMGHPGQIIHVQVSGGKDEDLMIGGAVAPLSGCPDCLPSDSCQYFCGDPEQICVSSYDNRNVEFIWGYDDPDELIEGIEYYTNGETSDCYVEIKCDLEDFTEIKTFYLTVVRLGSSGDEWPYEFDPPIPEMEDNFASRIIECAVCPTQSKFVLTVAQNTSVQPMDIENNFILGSQALRKDLSGAHVSTMGLKERSEDGRDVSVDVDYKVSTVIISNQVPGYALEDIWDPNSTTITEYLLALMSADIDMLIVNDILDSGEGTLGLSYTFFHFIVINAIEGADSRANSIIHEIGHCCGLDDNEILDPMSLDGKALPYNIMVNGLGLGANVSKGMDCQADQGSAYMSGCIYWYE